jgi:hypothetical protein
MKYARFFCFIMSLVWLLGCRPTTLVNTPTPTLPSEVAIVDPPSTIVPSQTVTALPATTPTVLPTATETLESTATPVSISTATATLAPTLTTEADWIIHKFEQVQLSLPPTFQIFDVKDFPLDIADGALSGDCQARLDEAELAFSGFLLMAIDMSTINESLSMFILVEEHLPPSTTLETTLDRLQLCDEFDNIESEIVTINDLPAGRVVVESQALGFSMTQISYLFQQDNQMWSLVYTFWQEDRERQLPILQQIVESFTIISE